MFPFRKVLTVDYVKLESMSASAFAKFRDRLQEQASALTTELIAAGYGNVRNSELHQMRNDVSRPADPLLVRFVANDLDVRDVVQEERRRMEYHGSLKPIKAL